MTFSLRTLIHAAASIGLSTSFAAFAQDLSKWPERPITLVVPFPAGGQTDVVARLTAEKMAKSLGQPIVVENVPGVNGSLGSDQVRRAKADGYTLITSGPSSHSLNQLTNPNVKYDARTDFTYVGLISVSHNLIATGPKAAGFSLQDIVNQSKLKPEKFSVAVSGVGSTGHMAALLMEQAAGIKFVVVPYKGDSPAITDVIGGQVDLLIGSASTAQPYIKAGKLKPLGMASSDRAAQSPNVPTLQEQGFKQVISGSWTGIAGPAGLPPKIVNRLNRAINEALLQKDLVEKLTERGIEPKPSTPEEAANFVNTEVARWTPIVKAAKVKTE